MIYLDSAAIVKLVHAEPESPALRRWLDQRAETGWISSVLTEIESFRALARYAPEAVSRLPAVLDQIDLIDLDQRIRVLARTVQPATVRSLDAIHLGTALQSRPGLTSFVTYDKRLLDAARTAGLPARPPTPDRNRRHRDRASSSASNRAACSWTLATIDLIWPSLVFYDAEKYLSLPTVTAESPSCWDMGILFRPLVVQLRRRDGTWPVLRV